MTTTETPQTKLATKNSALQKARKKLTGYLAEQDLLGEKIAAAQAAVTKGEMELKVIQELFGELETLQKEDKKHADRLQELIKHYESIPWSPDLADDQKLENDQEFRELITQRKLIAGRLESIPKEINKVYYRR
jgi:chromosome segregation ATPase